VILFSTEAHQSEIKDYLNLESTEIAHPCDWSGKKCKMRARDSSRHKPRY